MRNEYTQIERLAMLVELGLNYHEELKMAIEKNDTEKALMFSKLRECVNRIIEDVESRE